MIAWGPPPPPPDGIEPHVYGSIGGFDEWHVFAWTLDDFKKSRLTFEIVMFRNCGGISVLLYTCVLLVQDGDLLLVREGDPLLVHEEHPLLLQEEDPRLVQ